jgi:hypothetical protein
MTVKRYYYIDPLAAAWMSEHFGMRVMNKRRTVLRFSDGVWGSTRASTCVVQNNGFFMPHEGKLYIHPISVHLLEPSVGDLVQRADRTTELVRHVRTNHPALADGSGTALYYDNPHIKRGQPWIDKAFVTIIQRDGKAFHWPESERE